MEFEGTDKKEFVRRMEWIIFARFILYGLAFIIALFQMARGTIPKTPFYLCITLVIYGSNLIYLILTKKRRYLYFIAYLSLIIDLLVVTWAVHQNGGLASPIFPLNYILVILVASILISLKGGVIITTVASLFLVLLISLEYLGILPPSPVKGIGTVLYSERDYVILVVAGKIVFFYGVAIVCGYLSDRTKKQAEEILKKEEQLIKAERMAVMVRIASEAAHEIRNPLSVIKTGVYYLEKVLPGGEKIKERFLQIDGAVERVALYINDLLNLSKPPVLNLSRVDINTLIEESLKESSPFSLGIEIKKELREGLPYVKVDPDRLKEVFVNLIKNAAEVMKGRGELRVRSEEKEEGFIQISLEDTGPGIQEENLEKVFDPFFTTKTQGTGLGLAICKRIIDAHKGKIEVKSYPGQGTRFIISLPIEIPKQIRITKL